MTARRVFISMGTPYTKEYSSFRDELEAFLRDRCNVDPRIIGKNEYPSGSPLNKIKEVMKDCDGVIVVAYERKYLEAGIEKRGTNDACQLKDRTYTTPWNHIESAMAFSLGIPLYVICQRGLVEEGLIESKIDWYVLFTDISADIFKKTEVCESIRSWVTTRVIGRAKRPRPFDAIEGKLRFSEMTPKELLGVFGVLSTVFALGIGAARAFPKFFP